MGEWDCCKWPYPVALPQQSDSQEVVQGLSLAENCKLPRVCFHLNSNDQGI